MYVQGFSGGAKATMHDATETGLSISGVRAIPGDPIASQAGSLERR